MKLFTTVKERLRSTWPLVPAWKYVHVCEKAIGYYKRHKAAVQALSEANVQLNIAKQRCHDLIAKNETLHGKLLERERQLLEQEQQSSRLAQLLRQVRDTADSAKHQQAKVSIGNLPVIKELLS